jgi:hypothetical protein
MTVGQENFIIQLAEQTKTHEEWLSLVRFGLGTLLERQPLLAEILVLEAMREACKIPSHKTSDEIAKILREVGLKLVPV